MSVDLNIAVQACMIVMTASGAALMGLEWYVANRLHRRALPNRRQI